MLNPLKMPKRLAQHIVRNRAKYTAVVVIAAMLVFYGTILNDRDADVAAFMQDHGLFDEWQAHLADIG